MLKPLGRGTKFPAGKPHRGARRGDLGRSERPRLVVGNAGADLHRVWPHADVSERRLGPRPPSARLHGDPVRDRREGALHLYGATDEFGHKAAENVVTVYDLHATALHLLGLDHERLSYYHNGIERRLTEVH